MPTPITEFTDTTPRHTLPLLFAGQAQKEFHVNESLALIDLLLHPAFLEQRSDPPATPEIGACYLIADNATGVWRDQDGALAGWDGGQWTFAPPRAGMIARNLATGALHHFTTEWRTGNAPVSPDGGGTIDTEARAAIAGLIEQLRIFGLFS